MRVILIVTVAILCLGCAAYTTVPPSVGERGRTGASGVPFSAPEGTIFTEDYDVEPVIVHQIPPEYPDDARAAELEGMVVVLLGISENGSVIEGAVAQGIEGLNGAALAAVKNWRFTPAKKAGQPVAVRIPVPIRFTLRG